MLFQGSDVGEITEDALPAEGTWKPGSRSGNRKELSQPECSFCSLRAGGELQAWRCPEAALWGICFVGAQAD